jgi:tetratricopeptide (TPR) repeat protein
MRTTIYEQGPPDPALWDEPSMREALASRDMAEVFRLLKARGISQRRIAGLTGQAQPEISDILRGRVVSSYDLLSRIATGLGIPRGHMGLAYGPGAEPAHNQGLASSTGGVASWSPGDTGPGGSDMQRRAFITWVAQAAIAGVSAVELSRILEQPASASPIPVQPVGQIGTREAEALEDSVASLRSRDDLLGGGAVVAAAAGEIGWARALLAASASDSVRQRVQLAAADLYSAAGWAAFDTGDAEQARAWLAPGLALAKDANAHDLAAKVLFQLGRIYLHGGDGDGALKMFQLGQLSAQDSGVPRAVALMHLSSAWANAELGRADSAIGLLARAGDELARDPGPEHAPTWLAFMGPEEIDGISGMVYTALSARERAYAENALHYATRSYEARPGSDARSRASDQVAIAANHLRSGNLEAGVKTARLVLPQVTSLHSARLTDRLAWVTQAAGLYPKSSEARQLVADVAAARSRDSEPV